MEQGGSVLSRATIEAECQRLGHRLGWRLLTCPDQNIETATVALVTINPGGIKPTSPMYAVETGSAYVDESWRGREPGTAKLQRQVRRMFEVMDVKPEEALSGYLVPFRSRRWKDLPEKSASLKFGLDLWQELFARAARFKTVVAFGKHCGLHVSDLLAATLQGEHPAGWGNQTIDIYRSDIGRRLVVLPHLSTFSLFNRDKSEDAFRAAIVQ